MPEKKIPFKILTTPKPPPLVDYAAIYKKAIHNKLMEAPTKKEKIADWAKQCIYLTVKGLPIIYKERVFSGFSKRIAPPDKKKNEPIKILMGGDDAYD